MIEIFKGKAKFEGELNFHKGILLDKDKKTVNHHYLSNPIKKIYGIGYKRKFFGFMAFGEQTTKVFKDD